MAYGLKYELIGKSVPFGKNWKVRISQDGYTGAQIDRNVPSNPFILKKDSAGTIRGTSLDFSIRAQADFEFIDLYTNNSRDWLIELVDTTDAVVWQGFILPEEYQEAYSPAPVTVGFTATDGLGLLKNFNYSAFTSSRLSLLNIMANCLVNTGISLQFAIAIPIKEARQDAGHSVLQQIRIDHVRYDGMTCYNVVTDILTRYNASITQENGKWLIRSSEGGLTDKLIYAADGLGTSVTTESAPTVRSLGKFGASDAYPTGSALSLSLASANRVVSISENYGLKPGILPAQTEANWTDDTTLAGWTVVSAVTRLIKVGDPYLLVQFTSYPLTGFAAAAFLVEQDTNVNNSIEFSFDFAYVANYWINLSGGMDVSTGTLPPLGNLKVVVSIYDSVHAVSWYLSNRLGWTNTPSTLEISSVAAMSGIKNAPTWKNYKVTAGPIPVSGTLCVYLYTPQDITPTSSQVILGQPVLVKIGGAGFKNITLNILTGGNVLSPGIDYSINMNNSTKASKVAITWNGGDVPAISNLKLIYSGYTSLPDGTPTGEWKLPGGTSYLLIELLGKIFASQNRKPKQYLRGSIRGENISFESVLEVSYPDTRKFEILEASYSLCLDKADITLIEVFDYEESSCTIVTGDLGSVASSDNVTGGSKNTTTIVNNINNAAPITPFTSEFTTLQNPSITDYDTKHADTYGQLPSVRLWTKDADGNFLERSEKPKFIMVSGLIGSIVFDLPIPETGFIILS